MGKSLIYELIKSLFYWGILALIWLKIISTKIDHRVEVLEDRVLNLEQTIYGDNND